MIIDVKVTFPGRVAPGVELRRIRRWGDPVMLQYGFDYNLIQTSNFQAVRTWNKETGWGAVSNYLRIPRAETLQIRDMQFPQQVGDNFYDRDSKMEWLCGHRGNMYMYDDDDQDWQTADSIRWGTVSLGGNLVQIEGYEDIELAFDTLPRRVTRMARLKGFRRSDWGRSRDELESLGLVHRCFCVYRNNGFGDTPKGIIYSPFFSPLDYDFGGTKQPTHLYIMEDWLED